MQATVLIIRISCWNLYKLSFQINKLVITWQLYPLIVWFLYQIQSLLKPWQYFWLSGWTNEKDQYLWSLVNFPLKMVTILILWQHRVAVKAFFRQWKMSISICYRACTFLCNKRLSCSYYFIATPKILPYRVALQRSSVAVWRVMLFFLFFACYCSLRCR